MRFASILVELPNLIVLRPHGILACWLCGHRCPSLRSAFQAIIKSMLLTSITHCVLVGSGKTVETGVFPGVPDVIILVQILMGSCLSYAVSSP